MGERGWGVARARDPTEQHGDPLGLRPDPISFAARAEELVRVHRRESDGEVASLLCTYFHELCGGAHKHRVRLVSHRVT